MAQENENSGQPGWQIRNCYRKPTSLRYLYVISRYFASISKPASNSRYSYPFSLSKPTCLLLLRQRLRSSSSPSPKRCIDRTRYTTHCSVVHSVASALAQIGGKKNRPLYEPITVPPLLLVPGRCERTSRGTFFLVRNRPEANWTRGFRSRRSGGGATN